MKKSIIVISLVIAWAPISARPQEESELSKELQRRVAAAIWEFGKAVVEDINREDRFTVEKPKVTFYRNGKTGMCSVNAEKLVNSGSVPAKNIIISVVARYSSENGKIVHKYMSHMENEGVLKPNQSYNNREWAAKTGPFNDLASPPEVMLSSINATGRNPQIVLLITGFKAQEEMEIGFQSEIFIGTLNHGELGTFKVTESVND